MLKTVRDACTPHPSVFEDDPLDNIDDLSRALADGAEAEEFFERSHLTAGMRQLFDQGLRRLAGRSDQAVFELTQAMGGGKTHTMVAFGIVARHPALRSRYVPELAAAAPFDRARVVAFTGRKHPEHYFWGEIAAQLGKAAAFQKFWKDLPGAPDEDAWIALIGDEPTLILLDEMPPWFDYAVTRPVGGGTLAQVATSAFSNLLAAALKLPRVCIVVSNLSGTYQDASKELRRAIRNVENEARRQAKPITPVELGGDEIYQILKKRLFAELPSDDDIETVVQAYAQAIHEAERSRSIARSTEQIADEIRRSYPFHPVIKDIIALFRTNESYRQTRGLKDFVAKMIRSVWSRATNDVFLVGLQHLDLNRPDVRDEIIRINDLRNSIAKDIAAGGEAHAEVIDGERNSDAASQVATLLLAASLSTAVDAVKGLTKQRLLECLIAPQRDVHEFSEAFEDLRRDSWYLHKDASDAFYFSNVENLTKRLSTEAERAPAPKVDKEMRRRLQVIFEAKKRAAYQELQALPEIDSVRLNGPRLLLVLSPDTKNPPEEAQRFYEDVVEKNNMCVVTGDGSDLGSLDEKTRIIYAIAKLQEELPEAHPHQTELSDKMEEAEQDFNATVTATFNRVWYPTRRDLVHTKLHMTFEGNRFDGEEQVERALTDISVSKLVLDIEKDVAGLIAKAEDLLWPAEQKRVPWRDLRAAALSNPRWTWLPNNGMETLRRLAEDRGAWRSTGDGYIERGPFEKEKTSVSIQERGYDEATGTATIEVTPLHAGRNAQAHYAEHEGVSSASPRLTDAKLDTDATRLWFVAEDPSGEHETGATVGWANKLTLTHQPRPTATGWEVELRVVPRGTIRYTLTGANPKEGTPYEGPIPIGNDETTIYCYAEDQGVEERRNFRIPRAGKPGVQIDLDAPARLKRRLQTDGTPESFSLLNRLAELRAAFAGVSTEVGGGAENASARFGSATSVAPAKLEELVKVLRGSLGQDDAEVRLKVQAIDFLTGRDLLAFACERDIELGPNEVEQ
ncbi:MAG: DUF499 domain-containing protein [Deltaproteobacteria bacterium]|nr:DUF499 domain-containing protein [Deltaproteobacteria bacterium]